MDFWKWFKGLFPDIRDRTSVGGKSISDLLSGSGGSLGFADGIQSFLKSIGDYLNGTTAAQQQYQNNLSLQQNQQAFNSAEAEKQRQFEAQMANTQYQRAANDLRAAGLNPWLAVNGMNGSTPSGAVATSSASNVSQRPSGAETIGSLASTAVSAAIIAKIVAKLVK